MEVVGRSYSSQRPVVPAPHGPGPHVHHQLITLQSGPYPSGTACHHDLKTANVAMEDFIMAQSHCEYRAHTLVAVKGFPLFLSLSLCAIGLHGNHISLPTNELAS